MANTAYASVDAYIAAQPEANRPVLGQVRAAIRKAAPQLAEVISYQIPAYRLTSGLVLFFAGWKEHWSLYPVTEGLLAAFKDELAPYKLSKGTIRFPLSEPVPEALVEAIAAFRAHEAAERAAAKSAKPRPKAKP